MSTHLILNRRVAAAVVALAVGQLGCHVHGRAYVRETVYVEPPPPPRAVVVAHPAVVVDEGYSGDVVVNDYYEPLGNYGVWIDDPVYGRVWQPAPDMAGPGFRPYASDGQWVVNDDGDYVFVSRYDAQWGWATYHYGRWAFNDNYGWVWIPGRAWAPSWVEWRYGGGYVGWAPMGPPGVVLVESHYVFVEHAHIGSPTVYAHALPVERIHTAYVAANPIVEVHGSAHWKAGPPAHQLKSAGVVLASAHVSAPAAGYVKTQARATIDGAAERRATGRVTTTPQPRSATVGAGVGAYSNTQAQAGQAPPQPAPPPGPGARAATVPASAPAQGRVDPPGQTRADTVPTPPPGQARADAVRSPVADQNAANRAANPAPAPVVAPKPPARPAPAAPPPAAAKPARPAPAAPPPASGKKRK